ncbi:MAG TPA: Fur family transcriptional regulator [Xanthomonadaceae bacterium]|nr:Fur family transcriptional regulator [Xanthomonadaceae bacterium]
MANSTCSDHRHHHDSASFLGEVEDACRSRGLRLTPIRRLVLELIARAKRPVKAYELLDQLKDRHAGAAPPTIYRALEFLLEHRFIHKLESINAFVGCHHPSREHQAPFLICDRCMATVELADDQVASMLQQQARELGFEPAGQTLEVHGVCAECSAG